ncbi:Cytochrome c oxidase polypeptide III [Crocosphaera watsonii WH 0401]|uniref:Cytochrome c oxidase polypeptide III n=1 Tax=Crocosphaera watsonii WH 0401 TaxID=555881 RepID=T2JCH3_CROWT|nr:Cytochrome c oxidase polypeptide III [Crocosphaera watsonii WH 0401]
MLDVLFIPGNYDNGHFWYNGNLIIFGTFVDVILDYFICILYVWQ